MKRGIRAPGTPALGASEHLLRCRAHTLRVRERAHQCDVADWKGIGLAELTHGDVVRSPLADALQRTELLDRVVETRVRICSVHTWDDAPRPPPHRRVRI